MKTLRKILLPCCVLLGLLIVAYTLLVVWDIRKQAAADLAAEPAERIQVMAVSAGDIAEIIVHNSHGSLHFIRGDGDNWADASAACHPAQDKVIRLVNSVRSLTAESAFPVEETDLNAYGLEQPSMTVKLILTDGTEQELQVGNINRSIGRVYLMKTGEPMIYIHGTSLIQELDKELGDFE